MFLACSMLTSRVRFACLHFKSLPRCLRPFASSAVMGCDGREEGMPYKRLLSARTGHVPVAAVPACSMLPSGPALV